MRSWPAAPSPGGTSTAARTTSRSSIRRRWIANPHPGVAKEKLRLPRGRSFVVPPVASIGGDGRTGRGGGRVFGIGHHQQPVLVQTGPVVTDSAVELQQEGAQAGQHALVALGREAQGQFL